MRMLKLLLLASLFSTSALADITCYTPRMGRKIVIQDNSVAISKPFLGKSEERAVASVNSVRTKLIGHGFSKILFNGGAKHIVHINDANNFSEINDYLLIRSAEGHEMTYPLTCE